MAMILALDPGPVQTGWAITEGAEYRRGGILPNDKMLEFVQNLSTVDVLAIEMIASYGMPVGAEVFDTCVWIGRFTQAFARPDEVVRVFRQKVKLFLCHSPKAKDANVRQAILDLFPRTGGGKTPQIGTTKQPGPLFGVSSHVWPALGVALYINQHHAAASTHHKRPAPGRRARLLLPVGFVPVADQGGASRARAHDPHSGRRDRRQGQPQRRASKQGGGRRAVLG